MSPDLAAGTGIRLEEWRRPANEVDAISVCRVPVVGLSLTSEDDLRSARAVRGRRTS